MSLRFFEGEDHAKVYVQYRPIPPPSVIKRLVEFLREKYDGPLNLAADLGCGNGQCTFTLANEFSSVLGTDISPAQIAEATELCAKLKHENVKFEASPAESIPVPDKSAQLITICEAAHWMDLPKVFSEAKRALCPNGVLAIVGYHLPLYSPRKEDAAKTDAITAICQTAVDKALKYTPPQVSMCLSEYAEVTIPFSDFTRERNFNFSRTARISDIVGIIRTYSPFQTLCKKEGDDVGNQILEDLVSGLTTTLNEGRETPYTSEELKNYEFTQTYSYFILMARV